MQRGVNRLLYGGRDDPYAVLSRLGQRLESTLAPKEILPAVVRTMTDALRLPYAAIVLHGASTLEPCVVSFNRVPESNEVGSISLVPYKCGQSSIGDNAVKPPTWNTFDCYDTLVERPSDQVTQENRGSRPFAS